ncbi:ATP-binding protein [Clostridium sp. HCS.1]|uniref:HAMP domain-containing sensor histidine kinase n=1 Tax=Clostridium sp. HCS.1 TaxID=3238594 RepID=UPI003A0FD293
MKVKLTIKLLVSMILVYYITMTVYVVLNLVIYNSNITFGEKVFSVSFRASEFIEPFVEDLEKDNNFSLDENNINKLIDNNVWIQVLNKENNEVYQVNKPENVPNNYITADLIDFIQNPWGSDAPTTIYTNNIVKENESYTLLVGFPINKIFKFKMTFTEESLKYHKSIIVFALVLMIIVAYLFSRSLVKPMLSLVEDIDDLKNGIYDKKANKKGIFKDVSKNINNLSSVLKENEIQRKEVDKAKEEWIANISHDLKTPLSSIKGYAELLKGDEYEINIEEAKRYGSAILDNSNYIQDLVNDLSLVYKLKNKVIPINFKEENLISLIKESIIDLLNNSKYSDREINLNYYYENIIVNCDKKYLKRAINNLIINSLEHNSKDTIVDVSIQKKDTSIFIKIEDNGQGIRKEDLKNIFNRYYKGVTTSSSSNGSGLGMAIAKEVIECHGGSINLESEPGIGTKIIIAF